jgi:hypothetical protein
MLLAFQHEVYRYLKSSLVIEQLRPQPKPTAKQPFVAAIALLAVGCANIPGRPARIAPSSYSCMSAVLREKLPADASDKHMHCLAAGLIVRYCSVSEAYIASLAKEGRDLLSRSDVEWADWRADRAGIRCSRHAKDDTELASCCATQGYGD